MSLTQIQEIPYGNMIFLYGPPGSGKSTFCQETVLNTIETSPIIFVTTESAPSRILDSLRQKGLGMTTPNRVYFVDAFHQTMGLPSEPLSDTVIASSENLTSIGIGISKIKRKIEKRFLLIFDSLTSPYLMTGSSIYTFLRRLLAKIAVEGNAVLTCIDEGCVKEEDLVAMMTIANGIVKIDFEDDSRFFKILKHPTLESTKIRVAMKWKANIDGELNLDLQTHSTLSAMGLMTKTPLRKEVGDFVNLFWVQLARWSGVLWDPKRFPMMTYNANRRMDQMAEEIIKYWPLRAKFYLRFLMPKNFSKVKDMKKVLSKFRRLWEKDRGAITEYVEDISKTDEHYMRLYENASCWGLENVGAKLLLGSLGAYAGSLTAFERENRSWNIVETKCRGLGDPYCELKIVPGEMDELKDSLENLDTKIIEKIYQRLIDHGINFMLYNKPLWKERPKLGEGVGLHGFMNALQVPAMSSERYRRATRLGGVIAGKKIGENLMKAGINEEKATQKIFNLIEYCKVGKLSIGKTIKMKESVESFIIKADIPYCFFTTGFLNGFFSTVKDQYIREIKCIAVGDNYCEWEFK